nr:hypothetical protein [uncultured Rhodopila sp.]
MIGTIDLLDSADCRLVMAGIVAALTSRSAAVDPDNSPAMKIYR